MENDFDFSQVPFNWPLCYLSQCPRHEECLRYEAHQHAPKQVTTHPCVMPTALEHNPCPHFHPIRKVKAAAGFSRLFAELKEKHLYDFRHSLTVYLGGESAYYRYKKGTRFLMPKQQEWIRQMLRRLGYTEEVQFDSYQDIYLFD